MDRQFYQTPNGIIKALIPYINIKRSDYILDCCTGNGSITKQLDDLGFNNYIATDIYNSDYNAYDLSLDANSPSYWDMMNVHIDWTIINPPFKNSIPMLNNAVKHSKKGIAFLQRLSFLEPTKDRCNFLSKYEDKLSIIIFGQPRPSFNTLNNNNNKHDSVTTAWFIVDKLSNNQFIKFNYSWKI